MLKKNKKSVDSEWETDRWERRGITDFRWYDILLENMPQSQSCSFCGFLGGTAQILSVFGLLIC